MKQIIKVILFLLCILFIISCSKEEEEEVTKTIEVPFQSRYFSMGMVPMPCGWTNEEISDAYKLSAMCSEMVSLSQKLGWNTSENIELYQNDIDLALDNGLEIMISIDVLSDDRTMIGNLPAELNGLDFSNNSLRQQFKTEVITIVSRYPLKYLNLGLEINGYFDTNPSDFENYISLYKETYDTLKILKPDLTIGATFQYELLNGNSQWDIFTKFDNKLDILCLTTYPDLFDNTITQLPAGYYSVLLNIEDIPIFFTEIGWQGHNNNDDEYRQAEFIIDFIQENQDNNVDVLIWTLLHDWKGGGSFETMGLIDFDGRKKMAWDTWQKIYNLVKN